MARRLHIYYESSPGELRDFSFQPAGGVNDDTLALLDHTIKKGGLFVMKGPGVRRTAIPANRIYWAEVKDE